MIVGCQREKDQGPTKNDCQFFYINSANDKRDGGERQTFCGCHMWTVPDDAGKIDQDHPLQPRPLHSHRYHVVRDGLPAADRLEHPDLDLLPEIGQVGLFGEVELPVGVLELRDVVGALAQRHLDGRPGGRFS